MKKGGLIHYYYGDGKGKTTAALGLALRFAGQGGRVAIVQFLKNAPSGETEALGRLDNVSLLRGKCGEGFTSSMTDGERAGTKRIHEQNLKAALELVAGGGLLVLDEAADAVAAGLLDEDMLKAAVLEKGDGVEVVATGHKPLGWLIEAADYVTEMKKHRHPFDKGVAARRGVEF